jgi:hypothetical protein
MPLRILKIHSTAPGLASQLSLLVDLDQAVPELPAVGDRNRVGVGAGIEAVGGAAALHAEPQRAALLGRVGGERAAGAEAQAERRGAGQQFAAVDDKARPANSVAIVHDGNLLRAPASPAPQGEFRAASLSTCFF